MKPLLPFVKTLSSRKIMILVLCFLLGKLFLVGYFVAKSGELSYEPFLKQAVAQEKDVETEEVKTSSDISAEEESSSLTLLEKKRKELKSKEEELKQKEEYLNKLKADIENTLENLAQKENGIEKKIEQMVTLKKSLEEEELKKLAKVFESTPPEQAGPMFNRLDVGLAAKILFRMKGRNAGKIWGYVDPEQAVLISRKLSNLK